MVAKVRVLLSFADKHRIGVSSQLKSHCATTGGGNADANFDSEFDVTTFRNQAHYLQTSLILKRLISGWVRETETENCRLRTALYSISLVMLEVLYIGESE
jgi:hypothetical protein